MFKTIARLLFGGEEQTPEDVKSGEVLEEDWLVVSHQEAGSAEAQGAQQTDTQTSNCAPHEDADDNTVTDISVLDPDPAHESRSTSGRAATASVAQHKAVLEVAQLTFVQRARTWADRPHMTRNAIQRQNRVRQGVQHNFFHLQQPVLRNLGH